MTEADKTRNEKIARLIHVKGRVQAVGFRPFVWRLAQRLNLSGYVFNQPDGVMIHAEGTTENYMRFCQALRTEAPPAAVIKTISDSIVRPEGDSDFRILGSRDTNDIITDICPDIAVCDDCLTELFNSGRRQNYPFINCTNCGPRFTLIEDFPYDRALTTMHEFEMCTDCGKEYHNPSDRRFHAQPTSCFACGPEYSYKFDNTWLNGHSKIIHTLAENIDKGSVIALKGLGGYNLVCDAFNQEAVTAIRKFKNRDNKPFAVMFRDLAAIKKIVIPEPEQEELLISWRRPIVILNRIHTNALPKGVNFNLRSLGVFLPYLPLHYLLFRQLRTSALVVTSGNASESPILHTETEAMEAFAPIGGGILMNNRKIARRCDDSVTKIIDSKPQILRRSRGYAPAPVDLNFEVSAILAAGAELSNCFCIGKGNQAILSQHIGDLKNAETYDFYRENITEFSRMYRFRPDRVVCDLHPDYLSTRYALETRLPLMQVQHHHAHAASVMAEHGLSEKVIGLAFDGTGLGTDGHIWGSEVLVADFIGFRRISHFEYLPVPGGDLASKQVWRSGLAYLISAFPGEWESLPIPLIKNRDRNQLNSISTAMNRGINSPLSCSAGRLFDAVAAIISVCTDSRYHAEAPMLLEDLTDDKYSDEYTFSGSDVISFLPAIRGIVTDYIHGMAQEEIVTKFHNTVAKAIFFQTKMACRRSSLRQVVLSGGTFQNRYLTEKLVHLLRKEDLEVFLPADVPANDGGIALGQIAIAAHKI